MSAFENPTTRVSLRVVVAVSLLVLFATHWVGSAHPGPLRALVYFPAVLLVAMQLWETPRTPWADFAQRTVTIFLTWWILYYTAKW